MKRLWLLCIVVVAEFGFGKLELWLFYVKGFRSYGYLLCVWADDIRIIVIREPSVSFGTVVIRNFSAINVRCGVTTFACRWRKYHKQCTEIYITCFALGMEWWYLSWVCIALESAIQFDFILCSWPLNV